MAERGGSRVHERWARLRFSIIGALLAAPPAKGALRAALEATGRTRMAPPEHRRAGPLQRFHLGTMVLS